MKCENCTHALQPDWHFCPLCGTSAHQSVSPKLLNLTDEEIGKIFNKLMGPSAEKVPFSGSGSYGSGVRAQVFEVIVRQAIAGAPWHEICAGPMQVNQITPDEVEEEVRRRRGGDNEPPSASVPKKPLPTEGTGGIALALQLPSQQLATVRALILKFGAFPAVIAKEQARNIAQSTSEEYTESALHKHPALPNSPIGCVARILTVLNPTCGGRCTRMANGPGGIYFACDDSIWCILVDGHLSEYVRIKRDGKIASMRFDAEGAMYVATAQGLIYKIEQNKSGRILAQVGGSLGQAETLLKDVAVGRDYVLVSNYSADAYGIFKIGQDGRYDVLVKGPGSGTQGILIDSDGFLWCVEPSTGCIIKRSISGEELLRTIIASPDDFHASDGYDGSIAIDSLSRLYITIGKVGQVIRIDIATGQKVDTLFSGLNNPTGIACDVTGDLYILESGHNRILKLKMT